MLNFNKSTTRLLLGIVFVGVLSLLVVKKTHESDWFYVPLFSNREIPVQLPAEAATDEKKEIVLMFGGDVMLSRTVNAKMSAYNDYTWPFKEIASTTSRADITIVNLESPFLKDANYQVLTGSFSFKANPEAVEGMKLAGIDVVSLANNHMLNAGQKGLGDTLSILKEVGMLSAGAGMNEVEARMGAVIEKGDWKIAFLAYAYPNDNSVATASRPGIATLDLENLKEDITAIRNEVDLVIVSMHAGIEYVSQPGEQQKSFARTAIDSGADAVIGHHPHWPQTWEIYKDKPIFYSLGNFVFDQMWSPGTSRGLLAELTFKPDLSGSSKLIPIEIVDYGQARLWPEEKSVTEFWNTFKLEAPTDLSWQGNGGN
ncbi:capsular biosynthesis protein [Candidatus Falkowbacteria bacterium HGW-Falkowbacteria-2]|uniref:Capsular biosynthesis protein n=1 Tax=Candidatus Falkowbacteria bacterium HGW-Falkowbacteria-2 TaxID=2013769 RepID=A0A2N2E3C6_9BACT|nr:MAG: capsular biosynthesis protein [Candidatus Falkowbacteria bacterium HGW-Falkowbacteria-2]